MSNSASSSSSIAKGAASSSSGSVPPASSSRPQGQQQPHQQMPHPHQPLPQLQQHRQGAAGNSAPFSRTAVLQPGQGYRSHGTGSMHPDANAALGPSISRAQPVLQPSPASPVPRSNQYHPYDQSRHPPPAQNHQRPLHAMQRHHSQSAVGPNPSYPKQHQAQQQQAPHHHQPQPQQPQAPYGPGYGDAGFSSSSPNQQHSNYSDSRAPQNQARPGSHAVQSHHQSQPLRERDHQRTSSGHSRHSSGSNVNGASNNFSMGHHHSYSNNAGNHTVMESHRIITHRPSLAAHQLSNPLTGYMHIPESVDKDDAMIMPSIDVIDHLLDVHSRSIHPVLPMLHVRSILDQVHRNESPPSHLLFAVLGLASRFSDNAAFRVPQPGVERPPCTIFYERAKYFIKEEYDNSQMATVQTLLLMAVQQMGFCESQRAWLYVGMAIRMAQDLGLNKEPSEQELSRNRLQCELRKRTWWSVYVVERLVCAGLGKPLTITHRDCETGFPQQEDDEVDITAGRVVATRPLIIANFVHLIALSKIQGNILEFIKAKFSPPQKPNNPPYGQSTHIGADQGRDCRVDTSAAAFSILDKSLTEWRQNLPESLQNPTVQSPHFGLFLHLTYNTLIILLHRPEVPTSPTSASLCSQAAATISDITEILMDAKALTSMFISCLYAIFSAGIVHFMNIPSVRKSTASSTSSPLISGSNDSESSSSHTMSAKTNLKRCIDALKFLASHWVSAARRAKVLEDLLDLKHVSLKDLEVDTFKTSPVGPSWALDSRYKEVLIGPREGQDKLRQQCRSKVMAIHSLLANDDEFKQMQRRRSTSFPDNDMNIDEDDLNSDDSRRETSSRTDEEDEGESGLDGVDSITNATKMSPSPLVHPPPIGLGVQSPVSSSGPSVASPASVRTEISIPGQQPTESEPSMVLSTANLGISDSPVAGMNGIKVEDGVDAAAAAGLVRHESGLLTPMTMTTLVQGSNSPLLGASGIRLETQSPLMNGKGSAPFSSNLSLSKQGAMLDPFSMPSSISFPDRSVDRRPSNSNSNFSALGAPPAGPPFNTVWTTDSLTHRTTARSAASSPMITSSNGAGGAQDSSKSSTPTLGFVSSEQSLSLYNESSSHRFPGSPKPTMTTSTSTTAAANEREDQDLVWNDMPPTLGLDEWTAYIGAMMMRWLYASGQSSPRSTASS